MDYFITKLKQLWQKGHQAFNTNKENVFITKETQKQIDERRALINDYMITKNILMWLNVELDHTKTTYETHLQQIRNSKVATTSNLDTTTQLSKRMIHINNIIHTYEKTMESLNKALQKLFKTVV